jgi:3-deoxy-D-manno-octulosonic-acid transferase
MRWLYALLYTLGMVVALPYFLVTGLFRGKYLASAGQRFGFIPQTGDRPSCWIHCVSVGEFLAAKPLIRRIQADYPDLPVFLSTTTITGQKLAKALLPEACFFFPFDWAWCIRRVLKRLKPRMIVVLETELWPNFLWECSRQGVPVALVNGRISDRSFRRYLRVRSWLPKFRENLMQSDADAQRMLQLGADPEHTAVMGNLKFEFHPSRLSSELGGLLTAWKGNSLLWIAGSTMPGEEGILLEALKTLRGRHPLKLLIAPRHPERFEEAALLASRSGFSVSRRSLNPQPDTDVLILDTIGELAPSYECADIVFIGGTLRDFGGHNPIEPAYFGKPIVAGPYDSNFRSIFQEFRNMQAIRITSNIVEAMQDLLGNPSQRSALGLGAQQLVQSNSGATDCAMEHLRPYLEAGGIPAASGAPASSPALRAAGLPAGKVGRSGE